MAWLGVFGISAFTVLIAMLAVTFGEIPEAEASEPFLGEIQMVGFGFCPRGWATTDGQLLAISQSTALFSLLGTTYGGDGRTTFALPDLRGRDAVHVGNGPGLERVQWGQRDGTNTYNINVNNLPAHSHGLDNAVLQGVPNVGDSVLLTGNGLALSFARAYSTSAPATALHTDSIAGSTDNAGASQSINIKEPRLGVYHCIAEVGIYPSRN